MIYRIPKVIRSAMLMFAACAIILMTTWQTVAFAATLEQFYSENDIFFSDPCNKEGGTGGSAPSIGANNSTSTGTNDSSGSNSDIPFEIPATKGKSGLEEVIDSSGKIPRGDAVTFPHHAALGQEYQDYYITMRWGYVTWNWNGTSRSSNNAYYKWMNEAPRMVHVTNPRTGKSIYAVALEAGPAPWTGVDTSPNNTPKQGWTNPQDGTPEGYTGRVSGFPPVAADYLEAQQGMYDGSGDELVYEWAKDQSVKPGPTDGSASSGGGGPCGNGGGSGDFTDLNSFIFFDQCDPKYIITPAVKDKHGNIIEEAVWEKYGIGSVCRCACGPFSVAMIIANLNQDNTIDPLQFAEQAYKAKAQGPGTCGSNNSHWKELTSPHNLNMTSLGTDMNKARDILRQGGLVLVQWDGDPFTGGGHFIVIRAITADNKVLIASSGGENNRKQSEQEWDLSMFENGYSGPAIRRDGTGSIHPTGGMYGFTK